ncbi:sugar ABC transporter ATPase [Pseudomonas sp. LS44]|uniref:sugar ABC transporter ATPase n=1 Tax=Pseudomonas sp. LS44 TaxID=1357074 RepID=UPI00215B7559|nr:sugar ABC transporter ATPase [Pseudomonas sp. LS44]UVE16781.1 sugar ABC transporter ATPase [Pseudomonas sp. LS44]
MHDQQTILVPQVSSFPGPEAKARAMLRWLVQQNIVEGYLSACVGALPRQGYALAAGAERIVQVPAGKTLNDCLPFGRPVNGLEIITRRCIYMPETGFRSQARCPECRAQVGTVLLEHLEEWMPGDTDNFICPHCAFEDDINGFPFTQACAFSDLGFIFHNWDAACFSASFLKEFAARLGFPLSVVQVAGREGAAL